jgi:K+-sensing histidine kinase KdpD
VLSLVGYLLIEHFFQDHIGVAGIDLEIIDALKLIKISLAFICLALWGIYIHFAVDKTQKKNEQLTIERSSLIRSLSHSIKSPLTTMELSADMLGNKYSSDETAARSVSRIKDGVKRVTNRLDHLNAAVGIE